MKLNGKHLWLHLFILISTLIFSPRESFSKYSSRPIRRFIHVDDDENLMTTQKIISRSQRSGQSSYITDDIRKMSLDYPELINYMTNLARDKKNDGNGIRISRLYKAKEIQNDFRWEISFMYVGDYKYCEKIKRHHKQNNI
jgi:hypothetical protein